MTVARKIAKNTSFYFISQIIYYILSFFITLYTARYLGAEGFGILSLALSLTGILAIFSDLGLGSLTIIEVARDKSLMKKYLANFIVIKIILIFLMFGIIILSVYLLGYSEVTRNVIYIITLSVIIGSFIGLFSAVFQAFEKIEYVSLSSVLSSVIMLLGVLIGIYYQFDIFYFAYVYVITSIFLFAYIFIMCAWKFSIPKLEVDLSFWKSNLKEAWPFGVTGTTVLLYNSIDSVMLSVIQGIIVVGWYSAAYRLMYAFFFIPTAINMAITPVMSRLYSSKDDLRVLYEKYFKYMIMVGIPIGFGTTILAEKIILFIYGAGYTQSIIALQLLIWSLVISFAGSPFSTLLQSTRKQLIVTKIMVVCAIINIILNLMLIPKFSYVGSSISMIVTEIFLQGAIYLASYKLGYGIYYKIIIKIILKVLLASTIMSIFIMFFITLNLVLLIVISTIIYIAALYLVRGIDEDDILLLKEILNRN